MKIKKKELMNTADARCCNILLFFTLCLLLVWWGTPTNPDMLSVETCVNDPCISDLCNKSGDTRDAIELDVLHVDSINGNDTACIAASKAHTFMSIPVCSSIDAALSIALAEPGIDWHIYIRWGVYVSDAPVVLPCNVYLFGDGDYPALWTTKERLSLTDHQPPFCTITLQNIVWTSGRNAVFSVIESDIGRTADVQNQVLFELRFINVTFIESNIVINASSSVETRLSFNFTIATDTMWSVNDVHSVEITHAQWSNSILRFIQSREMNLLNSLFEESALYLHNSNSSLHLEMYGSVFHETSISIEDCYCTRLHCDISSVQDAIDPSCLSTMNVDSSVN